jgi:hypothetical protein
MITTAATAAVTMFGVALVISLLVAGLIKLLCMCIRRFGGHS